MPLPLALDSVITENIQNHFRHYMFAYLQGYAGGDELVKRMKKIYKSHRRVSENN